MGVSHSFAKKSADKACLKTGRHARFIYIYVPDLGISRMAREHKLDEAAPIAIYVTENGTDKVRYCNQAAYHFGIAPNMSLSDARALCALCRFYPENNIADRQWLVLLGRWCWRYSPVVGVDDDRFGLWIDCTGTDHLWDDEHALLDDIATHFTNQSLTTHIVMASYYGAALGCAITLLPPQPYHIADTAEAHHKALADLPLTAMRLSESQISALATIGMSCIGDLWQLKRGMIAMRFGEDVILRRDQMFGHSPERPVPLPHFTPVLVQQHYAEPIGGLVSLESMVADLLGGIAQILTDMMLGTRHVEIGWQTLDGQTGTLSHKLSRPSRDIRLLCRLFQEAGASIDAGFGIEYGWAKANALSAQMPQAVMFDDAGNFIEDEADKLSQLVDHLAARLGTDKVQSLTMTETWIPEQSQYFTNAQMIQFDQGTDKGAITAASSAAAPLLYEASSALYSPRPIRLLDPPEPIQAIALLPDHPPSQIRWQGRNWRIARATGPERIGPKWWEATSQSPDSLGGQAEVISRDYYRLETDCGHRLWVYRLGLPERGDMISWHLHGLFA